MKLEEYIRLCNRALEAVKDQLPASLYREAHGLINDHAEWGLAIEFVIDWIAELDLPITLAQFCKIESAMTAMGWGESERMVWLRTHSHLSPARSTSMDTGTAPVPQWVEHRRAGVGRLSPR